MSLKRLHPDELDGVAARAAADVPCYRRADLQPGIVHLGVGNFMRAHLAVATEQAIAQSGDLRWGIVGVSLQRPDMRDALAPQEGLYVVARRGEEANSSGQASTPSLQVIGCLLGMLVAPHDPSKVLDAIAAPNTRIVSLTVTEKGYAHDPATGRLRLDHPDVVHDLAHPDAPRGAMGFIVQGLARRRARGLSGVTLMSLDNLASNGHVLRGAVLSMATQVDAALAAWIDAECRFPCSMVDRIVPATTDDDRARVAAQLGVMDAWPVCAEPFFCWAVEDDFAAGRPAWNLPGMHFVPDAKPWETLKLRMVNGCHSLMACLGVVAGWPTVDAAINTPALRAFIEPWMTREIEPTLPPIGGVSRDAYRSELIQRWRNPAIAHKLSQIAMDSSQKIPPRWVTPLRERLADGRSIDGFALGVAAWIHHLRAHDEGARPYAINDPLAAQAQQRHAQAVALIHGTTSDASNVDRDFKSATRHMLGLTPVFGDLAENDAAVSAVARQWRRLHELDVVATLDLVRAAIQSRA